MPRRWSDGGEDCNNCLLEKAVSTGLCHKCKALERNGEPPKWYHEQEIIEAMERGTFLNQNESLAAGMARHLQLAFEKGFRIGRGQESS
jgi:hypothetical protein